MSKLKENTKESNGELNNTSCYFCNEYFEVGQLQIHLKHCGSILEQCPLRCGAWIQRRHREQHVRDCPQTARTRTSPSHARPPEPAPAPDPEPPSHTWGVRPRSVPLTDCVTYLENEVASIRLAITNESNQRQLQGSELDTLKSKLVLLDERGQHFLATLVGLRGSVDDEAERAANWAAQFKHDIANIQLAMQEIQSQQMSTAMRLESAVSSLLHEQHERELLEQVLGQHDSKIKMVQSLESAIGYLRRTVSEERLLGAESRAALEAELQEARRSSQQLAELTALRQDLQYAANDHPAMDRLAVLEVATATARAEAAEHAARADTLARDLRALSKSYLKMRAQLADVQARASFGSDLGSDNGHLIWKIDNFTAKMKESKDTDTILTSPLFRTSKYGYTLKAEVHLNGLGKWKGRHVTSTVRLESSQYDALLEWPCDLQVNIVLKDQSTNRNQAMDIVKSLHVRRKSSSKRHDYDDTGDDKNKSSETLASSSDKNLVQMKRQYIFIPHASLDKFDYIKNDTIFIELLVSQ